MPHFLQATNVTANPNVPLVPGVIPINQLTNQLLAARVITGYNFPWNAIFYIENIIVGQQLFYILQLVGVIASTLTQSQVTTMEACG